MDTAKSAVPGSTANLLTVLISLSSGSKSFEQILLSNTKIINQNFAEILKITSQAEDDFM